MDHGFIYMKDPILSIFPVILPIFTLSAISFYSTAVFCGYENMLCYHANLKKTKILDHISQSHCLPISQFNSL